MNKIIYENKLDMNVVANAMAHCLSVQYGVELECKMTPKSDEQLRKEGLIK